MFCVLTSVISALCLLAGPAAAQPECPPATCQSFNLEPGWNAIYLNVQPANPDPKVVFAGLPVRSVWTSGRDPNTVQFVCEGAGCAVDPVQQAAMRQRGWIAYVPPGSDAEHAIDAAGNRLVGIYGNRAFLIDLAGSVSVTLSITGRPLVPTITWEANAFSLTGFPIDPDYIDPACQVPDEKPVPGPTFADYFAPSPAHRDQDMYHLLPSGVWERIAVPERTCMRYGEAYWIYSTTGSDFIAPLAVEVPSSQGLSYGRSVTAQQLRFTNLSNGQITIGIQDLGSPAVPLSYEQLNTTPGPALGQFEWLPLEGSLALPTLAGGAQSARLAVRRRDFATAAVASVIAVTDGRGTRWLLPLEAQRDAAALSARRAGGAAADVSEMAGLWAGTATINRVSEPQSNSMDPKSTIGLGNLCAGGAKFRQECTDNSDCPDSTCEPARGGNTCSGGANDGGACASSDDCPGLCGAAPMNCAGGFNDGFACTTDAACPGGSCQIAGVCDAGINAGQLCKTDGGCPNSTCNTNHTKRCVGGMKDNVPCSSDAECGPSTCNRTDTGSEFQLRLLIHVNSEGKPRLLKQVIQMWQNGESTIGPNGVEQVTVPGRFVLLTDDTLIPKFQGASLRDGVPVGRRISTPFFDFPDSDAGTDKQALDMTGTFEVPSTLTVTIHLPADHPTNPFLHQYHPDHGPADSFDITREITLDLTPATDRSAADADFDSVGGTYTETISGLHRNPIAVAGPFQLKRVVTTPELNQ